MGDLFHWLLVLAVIVLLFVGSNRRRLNWRLLHLSTQNLTGHLSDFPTDLSGASEAASIRQMSDANPRWGAPRIHGELVKIGIEVCQTTVAKYMVRHRKPPSQTWQTFHRNHTKDSVSIDFFVVPAIFGFSIAWEFFRHGSIPTWEI